MTVRTAAAQALQEEQDAEAAQKAANETALRDAAILALRNVLRKSDGTMAVPMNTLTQNLVDLENGLVIVTDESSTPPVSLAARDKDKDNVFDVYLVKQIDGEWTRASGVLVNLADLGEALAVTG